jgi:hypothetical protein
MKNSFSLIIFDFKKLFSLRSIVETLFLQAVMLYSIYPVLKNKSLGYFNITIFLIGIFFLIIFNSFYSNKFFLETKQNKIIDILLSSGVSIYEIFFSKLLISFFYLFINLFFYFFLLFLIFKRALFLDFYMPFMILIILSPILIAWNGFFTIQTRYGNSLSYLLVFFIILFFVFLLPYVEKYKITIELLKSNLSLVLIFSLILSSLPFFIINKEKIVLL